MRPGDGWSARMLLDRLRAALVHYYGWRRQSASHQLPRGVNRHDDALIVVSAASAASAKRSDLR